jgi:thymidylate synthase ThyX
MIPEVTILADSWNTATADRLTTFLLANFPKCILAELNTHRMLSRNAGSVRAMPVLKTIEQVQRNPFVPLWTRNVKGMVGADDLNVETKERGTELWLEARDKAVNIALKLSLNDVAKQNVNRVLEPFMTVPVIVSATEWENFFRLRTAPDTQPEFRLFAIEMERQKNEHHAKELAPGEWHIPLAPEALEFADRLKTSVAMCARGSYGSFLAEPSLAKDTGLHDKLGDSCHWSPFEHQAEAVDKSVVDTANYRGFRSYRRRLGF